MSRIFISYRRDDSGAACGRIYEHLRNHFGRDNVFKDVDDIPYGTRFPDYLAQQLADCRVELVVIGRFWVTLKTPDGKRRRLDVSDDFVRTEIETGLRAGLVVVPLLVDNATMPRSNQFPASIRALAEFQGAQVRNDPDFATDIQRLIHQLERWLGGKPPDLPTAHALQAQMEKILEQISAVGDGDLRVQAEVTPDTLGVLADSCNYMIEELARVVSRIRESTFQVTSAAQRLLNINSAVERQTKMVENIAKAANERAQTAEGIASAMSTITETARQTNAAIRDANVGVTYLADQAEQLRKFVANFRVPDEVTQE